MSRRLVLPLCAALAAGAALVGPGAPSASAAGSCLLSAPSTVRIVRPYVPITLRANGACTYGSGWGAWQLMHPSKGQSNFVWFEGTAIETWDVYDFHDLGRQTWRPSSAYGQNYDELSQNTVVSDIRVGSWASVSSSRYAGRTTINTLTTRYATSLGRNVGWAGATGVIQYRTPGTSTWRSLKNVYANSSGRYSYTYSTSRVRDYRVAIYSKPTIWWAHSGTTRR